MGEVKVERALENIVSSVSKVAGGAQLGKVLSSPSRGESVGVPSGCCHMQAVGGALRVRQSCGMLSIKIPVALARLNADQEACVAVTGDSPSSWHLQSSSPEAHSRCAEGLA